MSSVIDRVRETLAEELYLVDELSDLSNETRRAILNRSNRQLMLLGTRHQQAVERLKNLRKSQSALLRSPSAQNGSAGNGNGLKTLLQNLGTHKDLKQLDMLKGKIEELSRLNTENALLLEKQYCGAMAFQHVLDLVAGVDKVYDSGGGLKRVEEHRRIEEKL